MSIRQNLREIRQRLEEQAQETTNALLLVERGKGLAAMLPQGEEAKELVNIFEDLEAYIGRGDT